jgi:hypothetical protein
MSLSAAGLNLTGGIALSLLYTLLSHPLESLREEWSSNARPFLDGPLSWKWPVPERVKEIVTGQPALIAQPYMLSTSTAYEDDPL